MKKQRNEEYKRMERGRVGRRWKANTWPWSGKPYPIAIPGKGMTMGRKKVKKKIRLQWLSRGSQSYTSQQAASMWLTLRCENREDPTTPHPLSTLAGTQVWSFPSPHSSSFLASYFQNPLKVAGLQGGDTAQGRDSPSQTVLHIFCSLL